MLAGHVAGPVAAVAGLAAGRIQGVARVGGIVTPLPPLPPPPPPPPTHGSHPLHSLRVMSAAAVHLAAVQYLVMDAEHVGSPTTTHGPQWAHCLVADATSPVVEHSRRSQSLRRPGVHWVACTSKDSDRRNTIIMKATAAAANTPRPSAAASPRGRRGRGRIGALRRYVRKAVAN